MHRERIRRLQGLMAERGIDVVLLSVGPDLPYFTGYEAMPSERLTMLVVTPVGEPTLVIPELEAPRAERLDVALSVWTELDDPLKRVVELVGSGRSIAVGDHTWATFVVRLQDLLHRGAWSPASYLTSVLRVRKDSSEVALLREAARQADAVAARIPSEVSFAGSTEMEVARQVQGMLVEEGHNRAEFAIVGSGPNGASPHHEPEERVIEDGDVVVIDFGGSLGGYKSDTTRTFVVGAPSSIQSEVHEVVLRANEAGRDAVEPGVPCEAVDRAAREVIEDAGYGGFFIHRTGHGIGLEVHEDPYMVEGNTHVLEEGMAFSVEPGIYMPMQFGVRIEDIVVCVRDGADVLNNSPRGLIEVR